MRVNKLDQTSDFLDEFTDETAMVKETVLNFHNQCLPLVFDHKKRCFYFSISLRYDLFFHHDLFFHLFLSSNSTKDHQVVRET